MLRGDLQQGQRRAQVVVQVATGSVHQATGAQDAGKHFLDRGLAAGTGDGGDRASELGTVQGAQLPQGQTAVGNHELWQVATWHLTFHQGCNGALGLHLVQVIVTIEARPGQGDKELPGSNGTAVDADAGKGCIVIHQPALQGRGQLAEGQWLKHGEPPRLRVQALLRPDRKNRGAGR
ncbi:hypothetical protein D3C81_1691220 [compost metagenome]